MCGFVGFVGKEKKDTIKKMANLIRHRGPDEDGYYVSDKVSLGFRRLSIIDLSNGSQPMYNENKDIVIVFNGEVYNYQDLREDLIKKGHIFKTETDTEVLIHGYEEYGIDNLLDKLRGMFAFVIYDIKKDLLIGVRDFYGIKPMYYYQKDKEFMFSSEIKSFLGHPKFQKELNRDMLEHYLTFQYSVGEDTFFKNVYKLRPGHYFTYHKGKLDIHQYYELKLGSDDTITYDEWYMCVKDLLDDSIKHHKISDVEVGSFLSSGVDSSLIATLSNVDKTFTVGYANKKYSEIDYAKDLSKKINVKNESREITKEEYFKTFPSIQYYMDEPLADPSAIMLYFVAREASKNVKVALSGEGADEIFGGYNIYMEPYSVSWYYKIPYPIRRFLGIMCYPLRRHRGFNFIIRRSKKLEDRYVGNAFIFDNDEVKKLLTYKVGNKTYQTLIKPYYDKVKDLDEVQKMQYIDFNFWLIGDILLKADKMSMANSLEVRVPYLDRELIDYASKLPTKYKICNGETKYLFRQIAREHLEDKVAKKKKLGFPVPIREWLKEDDIYTMVKTTFQNNYNFFNTKYLLKLLEDHKSGKRDNSRKIWTVYTFLVWYREYFITR